MTVRGKNNTTASIQRCKENLREQLKSAADLLKNSLLAAHGEKRRHGLAFIFDDAYEVSNRKLWEPIRSKWRRRVGRAFTESLPAIIAASNRPERVAEQQGILAGKMFHQTIEAVFPFREVTGEGEMLALVPPGMAENSRALYEDECKWIESVLHDLLAPELRLRTQLPSRKTYHLSPFQLRVLDAAGVTDLQKRCLSLRIEYGLKDRRIAEMLGCSRATVRGHLKAVNNKTAAGAKNEKKIEALWKRQGHART